MHSILNSSPHPPRRTGRLFWAGLLALLLVACGTSVDPYPAATPDRYDLVASVDIDPTASRAEVEAAYGGSAVVFRPEAGFAILGFHEGQADLSLLNDTDPNQDVFATPEVEAAGWTAWGGGWTAWSGGWTAWSGGWTAWSGGWTAWSGGSETPSTFGENLVIWDQINLPEAQQLAPNLGAGVKVAVIDTGIDLTHPGFAGKLAPVSEWKDYVDGDGYPMDEPGGDAHGHGTGVAGVVLQVAPEVTLLPIRVLRPDGSGDVADVNAAIDWAIQHGAQIINLSLGSTEDVASLHAMIEYAFAQEVFVIASAGNADSQDVTFPARRAASGPVSEYTVGVGSVGSSDVKSPFSNYGENLELMAPGENITTLLPGAGVGQWSGTSFAAPIVTGALALGVGETDDPKQFANEMARTSVDVNETNKTHFGDKRYDKKLGEGRLDIAAFLTKVL